MDMSAGTGLRDCNLKMLDMEIMCGGSTTHWTNLNKIIGLKETALFMLDNQ